MTALPILRWPDPRLSEACAPVGEVTDAVRTLAADMLETMYAAPGRGLAAPQVGVMRRLFVMDVSWKDGAPDPVVCIDPEILATDGEPASGEEGCLSIPGIVAEVARPGRVELAWTDLDGRRQDAWLDGFAARCAQHELDHLDGIVTLDRVADGQRAALVAAYDAA